MPRSSFGGEDLESWELMRIRGIPLRVHPSWFFILLLFTWTAQGQVANGEQAPVSLWLSWGLGLITALLLFLSVLLHELGHSFVALNEGVKVSSITLFLLGGVARIEKECPTPMGAFRVAVAGPLVSLVLAIVCLYSVQSVATLSPLIANLIRQIGSLNLVLALFNLLPGLPLDGGVILKSLVWQFTGSYRKGLKVANTTGRYLSILAIFLGVWISLRGGGLSGLWLIMLGWFGLSASRSQSQILILQKILNELSVRDSASKRFRVIEKSSSIRELSKYIMYSKDIKEVQDWILVCDGGRWVGYIDDQPLKELPVQKWDNYPLSDFIRPLNELPRIEEKSLLWKAVSALDKSKGGRLLVFNIAGLPSGTIDRVDVGEAVLKRLGINLPKSFLDQARSQNIYPLGLDLSKVVDVIKSNINFENKE